MHGTTLQFEQCFPSWQGLVSDFKPEATWFTVAFRLLYRCTGAQHQMEEQNLLWVTDRLFSSCMGYSQVRHNNYYWYGRTSLFQTRYFKIKLIPFIWPSLGTNYNPGQNCWHIPPLKIFRNIFCVGHKCCARGKTRTHLGNMITSAMLPPQCVLMQNVSLWRQVFQCILVASVWGIVV